MDEVTIRAGGFAPPPPAKTSTGAAGAAGARSSFGAALNDAVAQVNGLQLRADDAITQVQLNDAASLHEAIIALEKADISFRTMIQVRNKIVEAYQEIMRLQM